MQVLYWDNLILLPIWKLVARISDVFPICWTSFFQVHKETIDKVPNSQPSRGNIEIEIYGMEGIPEADLKAHESARGQDDDDEPAAKHAKSDSPAVPTPPLQVISQSSSWYFLLISQLQ